MVSFILPGNSATGGFNVDNSLRFNDGSSDYLDKSSYGTPTSQKKFTWSCWFKLGETPARGRFFDFWKGGGSGFSYGNGLFFTSDNQLGIGSGDDSNGRIITNRVFRDPSAWYHVVAVYDSPNSTAGDRLQLYVNGVRETDFSANVTATQNWDYQAFTSNHGGIGTYYDKSTSSEFFDGYMAEVVFIDGQALDPTSFGEFDEDSGIWKPINVSGLTFGNNGFYLDFEDSSALGNDKAGSNNFTVNNLTAIDQSTDTCTNNFCTLNPLTKSSATFSEGNLKQGGAGASAVATFGVSSGKWYFEQKILGGNNEAHLGFALENSGIFKDNVTGGTVRGSGYVSLYSFDGKIYNEGSATSSFGTFSANDIIGFALDVDAGDIFLYQNGTVLNSGSAVVSGKTGKTWFPFGNFDSGNVTGIEHNFGGTQTFTISSGNTDGNGYGNFEYSVPSGYYALNSKNLAEYG